MKTIINLFLGILITSTTLAQVESGQEIPQDPKAKEILDALSKKTKSHKALQADFSYNLSNKEAGIDETQKGQITVQGNNKYKIKISGQEIISDGKTLWTYIKDSQEVQIDNAESGAESSALSPSKIFTLYEDNFKYKYHGEETIDGKLVQIIKLFPMNANDKNYHTAILRIDKSLLQIHSIIILSKDGNRYTYTIEKFTGNPAITEGFFNFDTAKAEEVIDLR